jgi:hypothetical protein
MEQIPLEDFVIWGARYRDDKLREQDQCRANAGATAQLEELYAGFVEVQPQPPPEVIKAYMKSCRMFHEFCDHFGFCDRPARAGAIAGYLHGLSEAGASHAELRMTVEALSYSANLNEVYDATDEPLVRAVLRAASVQPRRRTEDH